MDSTTPSQTNKDLETLIEGVRNRDVTAFAELIKKYEKRIVTLLWSKGYDRETIEDITQETYITVWEKIDQLQSAHAYPSWVFQIAINNGQQHRNKMIQRKNVFERFTRLFPLNMLFPNRFTSPSEPAMSQDQLRLIHETIATLPDEERSVISLRYFAENTYSEIAEILGISESVVRGRLKNATKTLRLRLNKMFIGGVIPVIVFTSPLPKVQDMIYSGKLTLPAPEFLAVTTTAAVTWPQKFATILMYFAFPFLWLMSILVSGHVCAHKFVTTAPTLAMRRWLVQQTFYCYCLIVMIPLATFGMMNHLEGTIEHSFKTWFLCLFFVGGVVFMLVRFYWLNMTSRKYWENAASPPTIDHSSLSRQIHYGFVFGTASLVLIYCLDFYQRYQSLSSNAFWVDFIIPFSLVALVFFLFHLGSFCLYQHYLALSKDEAIFQKTFTNRDWSLYTIWDEFCFLSPFLVVTLGPQAFKLLQDFYLPVNGRIEFLLNMSIWCVVIGMILWVVGASLWYYPHSMSYFNETIGGAKNGPKHLLGSNVDWGQNLYFLKTWYEKNPEKRPIAIAYSGAESLERLGIKAETTVPEDLKPGWYAIGVNELYGSKQYERFKSMEPVDRIGWSIYIYHLAE